MFKSKLNQITNCCTCFYIYFFYMGLGTQHIKLMVHGVAILACELQCWQHNIKLIVNGVESTCMEKALLGFIKLIVHCTAAHERDMLDGNKA